MTAYVHVQLLTYTHDNTHFIHIIVEFTVLQICKLVRFHVALKHWLTFKYWNLNIEYFTVTVKPS